MASPAGIREYSGYQQQAVPDEYLSSSNPRMFQGQLIQKVIQSGTGSVGANSRLTFSIPAGESAYIRPNSAYITGTVSVSTVGGAAVAPVTYQKCRLANSMFKNIQLTANGQLIQRVDQLNDVNFINYVHGTNQNYYANDARLAEGDEIAIAASVGSAIFQIPVALGCLNSSALPLFALPSNAVLLEVETESAAACIRGAGNYLLSNVQLVYESLQIDTSMAQMLRQEMAAAGQKWTIPFLEFRSYFYSGASALQVVLGLNLSSVQSVFVIQRANVAAGVAEVYSGPTSPSKFDVYADGRKVNNLLRDDPQRYVSDMNLALSKLYDPTCSSHHFGSTLTRALYASDVFCAGQNLSKSFNNSVVMRGSPINSLNVDLQGFTANNVIIVVAHQSIMEIDPMTGLVTLIR